ncbi:YqcC family protein [Vibrio sp.]|uniref:YqcC family protein n=1 Tax=Vibrio sp. TaxID=678 RepID=UPI00311D8F10
MADNQQMRVFLEQLTKQMKSLRLWQSTSPSEHLLESNQPFAVDTLQPHEWLQWIFIPKMTDLIERQMPLPKGFCLAPYFEQCWKNNNDYQSLIDLIKAIDEACA